MKVGVIHFPAQRSWFR